MSLLWMPDINKGATNGGKESEGGMKNETRSGV
jgi:hypothetical protein